MDSIEYKWGESFSNYDEFRIYLDIHNLTISQSSQSHILTILQSHDFTILQSHDFTMAQSHNATIPRFHNPTISQWHNAAIAQLKRMMGR